MEDLFRTTEISDPQFESGNLRFITIKTGNLKGRGDICVFVPPIEKAQDLPIIILLHGVYGSAWVWSQKAGVHHTAWEMIQNKEISPMVIAMPSDGLWGDGSAYVAHHRENFEKWIVDDVPHAIIENIPAVSEKSSLFISGLSMGGFGAMRLGIKYSEKFKAISAHSSITDVAQMKLFVEESIENYKQEDPMENTLIGIMKKYGNSIPKLRFDCGLEDVLLLNNRELHNYLNQKEIEHIYEEFPGGHTWKYWQEHIKKGFRFFSDQLP